MPIDVYTGQPGNGKTALAMERLMTEAAKGERLVFAAGIEGLNVDGVMLLDDPRTWNDKDVEGNHLVPDGSIIFVDEAWKWFGHLHDATRAPTPKHVLALAEHRHRGLDFVWTTQQPNQLYPFVRGLIGLHSHVVRRFGTHFVDVFQWEELNEDVKSTTKRENAQRTTRTLPKSVFDKYKSASLHTIKRRIPLKLILLPVLLVAAGAMIYYAIQWLSPDATAQRIAGEGTAAAQAAPSHTINAEKVKTYSTAADYHAMLIPRVSDAPWTAPAFDGRAVQADPAVYCMASSAGTDGLGDHQGESCKCITEQGTPFPAGPETCRRIAREGAPYNPFKAPRQENEKRVMAETGHNPVAAPAATETLHASEGTTQPYGSVATYGEFGLQ